MKPLTAFTVALFGVVLFLAAVSLSGCAVATSDAPSDPPAPLSACAAFGSAPDVTTIRTPITAEQPHPDCVELPELSAAGQRQFCCMGDDFKAWRDRL